MGTAEKARGKGASRDSLALAVGTWEAKQWQLLTIGTWWRRQARARLGSCRTVSVGGHMQTQSSSYNTLRRRHLRAN